MKKRVYRKKETPIQKMVGKHKDHCSFFIYSGDRHCSCGRNEAVRDLLEIIESAEKTVSNPDLSKKIENELAFLREAL